jgi:hypothetical protein
MKFKVAIAVICSFGWLSWAMEGENAQPRALLVTIHQKTLTSNFNIFWDNYRKGIIEGMIQSKAPYEKIEFVIGEQLEDNQHMKKVMATLSKFKVLDYFSFVHGGDQWIKVEWFNDEHEYNAFKGKLRFVYSEGCHGGSGLKEFVEGFDALVSVGHTKDSLHLSASPFFSFVLLASWLDGKSIKQALADAWITGTYALTNTPLYFTIAQAISRYDNAQQAIKGSRFQYAYQSHIDLANFTITSGREKADDMTRMEETITDTVEGDNKKAILDEIYGNPKMQDVLRQLIQQPKK